MVITVLAGTQIRGALLTGVATKAIGTLAGEGVDAVHAGASVQTGIGIAVICITVKSMTLTGEA